MTAEKVIAQAVSQIGYSENQEGSNKTKFGKWFGLDGLPWCGMFVSWCYYMAGLPLKGCGFLYGFAGCQTMYAVSKKKGWIVKDPAPGDIVLFDFNADGRYDHCGIFEMHSRPSYFISIEGNTSKKNNSNGGFVMRRSRAYKNCVFIRPKF